MSILDTIGEWQAENPVTAMVVGTVVGGVVFGTAAYYAMEASNKRRIKKAGELAAASVGAGANKVDPKANDAKTAAENAVDEIVRQAQPKSA